MPPTVVIAAHNEAGVIGRCLSAILADAEPGEIAALVVSNGSTDGTATVARASGERLGHAVDVLEVPVASKIAALRAAEAALAERSGVRIYVDADVVLRTPVVRLLVDAVRSDRPRLGLVTADVDTSACRPLARSYFATWAVLAGQRSQGSGTGVLAVNEAGIARIRAWPDVMSDDEWVVRQFAPDERVVVPATVTSFAARTLPALVKRRARVVNGNRQLDARWPQPPGTAGAGVRLGELRAARNRGQITLAGELVYVGVTVAARVLAAWRRRTGSATNWSRDASSRA